MSARRLDPGVIPAAAVDSADADGDVCAHPHIAVSPGNADVEAAALPVALYSRWQPSVAVVGTANLGSIANVQERAALETFAEEVGYLLASRGCQVWTGGLGGVMEAACRGAKRARPRAAAPGDCRASANCGTTVGILPSFNAASANPYVDVAVPTGMDIARNSLVAHANAMVAVGGGAGTLSELSMAWQLRRPIAAVRGILTSGDVADRCLDARRPSDVVYGVDSDNPQAAVDFILRELSYPHDAGGTYSGIVSAGPRGRDSRNSAIGSDHA